MNENQKILTGKYLVLIKIKRNTIEHPVQCILSTKLNKSKSRIPQYSPKE